MADNEPTTVEPTQEYLGFECGDCHRTFPIVGPLDPVEMPPGQPMKVGSRGPLSAECPHCHHKADYPIAQLRRFRVT